MILSSIVLDCSEFLDQGIVQVLIAHKKFNLAFFDPVLKPCFVYPSTGGGGTIKNIDEFYSLWRCLEIEERIDFMAELGHQNIARLFQVK